MPNDYGHEYADKELKSLEKRITKEYKQAAKEVEKKMNDYLAKFADKDAQMKKRLGAGEITASEYAEWRMRQMFTGDRWKAMSETLSADLVNVDKIAAGMINDSLPSSYAENFNYGTYEVEHGAKMNTNFVLYDKDTVINLMKDDPKIIPKANVDIPKDMVWNKRKIISAVTQGILQGEAIPKIAKRLQSVTDMDRRAAIRNARTYTTAAENKGRIDSYDRAKDMGINVKKEWLATLDDLTRVEHRHLDGMAVDNDEPFETDGYKIMYPGDPDAEPEMIYSCRCTIVARIVDYKYNDERNDSKLGDMTYEEWKHAKDKPGMEPDRIKKNEEIHTNNPVAYDMINLFIEDYHVDYRQANDLPGELSEAEIINKLAGGDMTKGSCASLSLAYSANKCGLDVTDYRGGDSRVCFARRLNLESMIDIANANKEVYSVKREAVDTVKYLKALPQDKEYLLIAGRHAAIVKNTEDGLQYLELQNAIKYGWRPFEWEHKTYYGTTYKHTASDTLADRFGCRKSYRKSYGITIESKITLAEVDSFQATTEFKEMMGYINTDPERQQKGAAGGEK